MIIGIIDVTTIGSTICQRRISELGGKNGDHPEFVVHSLPFSLYKKHLINEDWHQVSNLLIKSIKILESAGADFIIMPSNTPHYSYKEANEYSTVPFINLISVVANHCENTGYKNVTLLGTKSTMSGGLYTEHLEKYGIKIITPNQEVQDKLNSFILNEVIPEKINPDTLSQLVKNLSDINTDAFILGCTELPDVFSEKILGKPCIDTTQIIADKAFEINNKGL